MRALYDQLKIFLMASKMMMQKMILKLNMQRQLTTENITHNHHRYTKDMQNITIVGGKFRTYSKALEKHWYQVAAPNRRVETRTIAQKLWNLSSDFELQSRIQRFRRNSNQTPNEPETDSGMLLCYCNEQCGSETSRWHQHSSSDVGTAWWHQLSGSVLIPLNLSRW